MGFLFEQIPGAFSGRANGASLKAPLDKADVAAIESAMDKYAVLVFPDQSITDEEQVNFAHKFGALEESRQNHIARADQERLGAYMADVSNLDTDGRPLAHDDRRRMFNLGNQLWHSDSSFREMPAKYSILSGRVVSPDGGNTEFADMRAAYDALDSKTKARVDSLICEHSLMFSRAELGFELAPDESVLSKRIRHPLVRVHPVTGRRSLFLSAHAGTIVGWQLPEARAFLRELTEHATQREFVYVHKWQPYDLLVWDNRQTMHRVRRFEATIPRDMRRVTVAGESALQIEA